MQLMLHVQCYICIKVCIYIRLQKRFFYLKNYYSFLNFVIKIIIFLTNKENVLVRLSIFNLVY